MNAQQIQLLMTSTLKQIIDNENLNGDQIYRIGEKIYNFKQEYEDLKAKGATDEDIFYALYPVFDKYLQGKISEYAKDNMPVSCRLGCTHCCHYRVDVWLPEAMLLLMKAQEEDITIDWEYVKKQAEIKDNFEHGMSKYSKCVFLKDGRCTAYEVRPLSCRKYYVFTPEERCNIKTHQHGQVGVIADLESEVVVSGCGNVNLQEGSMAEMLLVAKEILDKQRQIENQQQNSNP